MSIYDVPSELLGETIKQLNIPDRVEKALLHSLIVQIRIWNDDVLHVWLNDATGDKERARTKLKEIGQLASIVQEILGD